MWVAVTGMPESGKTLTMSMIGIVLAKLTNQKLYSIHDLKGVEYIKLKSLDDLRSANNGIVLLDEFWLTLDSRTFSKNVELSQWVLQARKKGIIVFYTSQTMGQIDVRLRNITDWQIHIENKKGKIWLNFILYSYGLIGSRFMINNPEQFYSYFDTNEVGKPLS